MSRDFAGKRYWLVGASEGLGRALAMHLSRAGAELILSARSADRLDRLAGALPGPAEVAPCDVADRDSVAEAARIAGRIDGFVWTVGLYWPQSAQAWVPGEVEAMCNVNFTGLARTLGHVVPQMVGRDAGHIVVTGSLSSFRGLPGAQGYAPSKAGVSQMAECLYADLRQTGIDVQLVNPGFIKTRLTDKNDFRMPFLMAPEDAARQVWEHMNSDGFRRNFPGAFAAAFRLGNLLPDWLYYRIFA